MVGMEYSKMAEYFLSHFLFFITWMVKRDEIGIDPNLILTAL